jgi:hypothetical protein
MGTFTVPNRVRGYTAFLFRMWILRDHSTVQLFIFTFSMHIVGPPMRSVVTKVFHYLCKDVVEGSRQ